MDNQARIKKYSDDFIKKTFKRQDLKNFFLDHPYRKKFLNNMCEELQKIEYSKMRKFDEKLFNRTVSDMTKMFCQSALEQKNQELMTDIQKSVLSEKLAKEEDAQKEFDQEVEGVISVKRTAEQLNSKPKRV